MAEINRGPLTTTFVPPVACSSQAANVYQVPDGEELFWAQGPIDLGSCWPSSYFSSSAEYYSPGRCPSGYAPACNRTHSIGAITETIQTCCPAAHSYTCAFSGHPGWGGCYWDLPSTTWTLTSVYIITGGSTVLLETTTGVTGAINALSIQVRFQSTDFVSSTELASSTGPVSSTSTEPSSRMRSTSTTTTEVSDAKQPSAAPTGNGGITAGAKVGIGVGVSLGVLALLVIGVLILLRRRKRKSPPGELHELPNEIESPAGIKDLHEVPNQTKSPTAIQNGVPPRPPVELM